MYLELKDTTKTKNALSLFFVGYSTQYTKAMLSGTEDFTFKLFDLECNPKYSEKGQLLKNSVNNLTEYAESLKKNLFVEDKLAYKPTYKQNKELPLFFYQKELNKDKSSMEYFKQYLVHTDFGYYNCLEDYNMVNVWLTRLSVLLEANAQSMGTTLVMRLLEEYFKVKVNRFVLSFKKDDTYVNFDQLDNEDTKLLNVLLNLAFRSYTLNFQYHSTGCFNNTKGVVVTTKDMEKYNLEKYFPKLQFVYE